MNPFLEMQTFVAVVDAGSFVGAAEALGVSKAAVSRHVTELEARLGIRLLNRTTRRLSLTQAGQAFHQRSTALLADLAQAEAEASADSAQAVGLLRVNAPLTFGNRHLAPLWGEFQQQHPRLRLEVTLMDRVVDIVEEGYDLAVRIAALPDSSLVSRPLAHTRMLLCASAQYLRRQGTPQHPRALAQHRVIGYSYLASGDEWHFDGPDGRVQVRTQPWMRSNSGDTCHAAALAHQGIVLQPDFLVGEDVAAGRLVHLLPQWQAHELGIHAVYPTRTHVPPKVRLLVDFLAEAFKGRRWS